MIYLHTNLNSEAIRTPVDVNVLLPDDNRKEYPVLWLLHGMYGNYSDWLRRTSVERYAEEAGIAVVMPSGENSYYEDMAHGAKYYTYISEELPKKLRAILPLSDKREDNYIAGLSMGGYGAMKFALRRPEHYAAVASFSGVLDLASFKRDDMPEISYEDFGDREIAGTDADLMHLLRKNAEAGVELPRLYGWCGREDFLYQQNLKFRDLCVELKLPYSFHVAPGAHEWKFWDMAVREYLDELKALRAEQ